VVREDKLSAVLSEFARTLVTDFPIQGILNHFVERVTEILPVTAAGVTLIAEGMAPRYVAASNEFALRFEQLQSELGQGPCRAAHESGQAVAVPDLATDDRFPRFGPPAVAGGLAAVFTFPLCHGPTRLGALDLYRDAPGELDPQDLSAAQTLADVVVAYLLNADAREEARLTSDRLHHIALHDSLTGLPNRLMLQQRLEHAAQRAVRSHANAAVIFADLDRFKEVNDTHGHQVGDQLLRAVAERLSRLVRPGDTLARVHGDEFVFLCEDLHSPDDVELLASRIVESFDEPFHLEGRDVSVGASVGMAFAGPGEAITDQLIVAADDAMYRAKRRGGGGLHRLLDLRGAVRVDDASTDDPAGLDRDLRAALESDALELAYQPIISSTDGQVSGVEALLRWTHPVRGRVAPARLVPVAEQSGLITQIGTWVLERSCRDHARWTAAQNGRVVDLSVNVSARQLMAEGYTDDVVTVLERTGMDPRHLVLEMTENILLDESARVLAVLDDLRDLGIRLALDDFGTGYSPLSYLRRLPVHIVKIDQSFVADIDSGQAGTAIVAGVTTMAHQLGLTVVAEGVETASQRDGISAIGCDAAQGRFYAPPMPSDDIVPLLVSGGITGGG
jgi:diguanylate cyclase (GGDEF)-like protein